MSRFFATAALGLIGITAAAVVLTNRPAASSDPPAAEIAEPARTAAAAPAPPVVPRVPPQADRVAPVSYVLVTTRRVSATPGRPSGQRVTRGRTRTHLRLDGGRREWLFERNPVHPDRTTGYLIDHDEQEIRVYDDSALRHSVRIRGWADVVLMGFDPAVLAALRATGATRQQAGITFREFVAAPPGAHGTVEAWWSEDALLALEWTRRESDDRTITARVTGLTPVIDAGVLDDPQVRFPGYRQVDAADTRDH